MDEGKPTKPKWWSRPRTHVPESAPPDPVSAGDGTSGFHGSDMDGDFELEKPAVAGASGAAGSLGGPGGSGAAGASGGAGVFGGAGAAGVADAFSAETPTGSTVAPGGTPGQAPARASSDVPTRASSDVSADASGGADAAGERPEPPGERPRFLDERPEPSDVRPEPPGGRPRPLHDPDPYSTPPYGGPGPWAPAPPVQHPGTTPAHGTAAVHAVTPPQGTPAGAGPEDSVPRPAATQGILGSTLPSGYHQAAAPLHGTPDHGPTDHGAPAQAPAPHPGAPHAPGPHASAPQALTPHVPAAPAPVPQAGAQAHPQTHPQPHPQPDLQPHHPQAPHTPWQNYDPWAAAPLQQNGAAVETTTGRRRRRGRALVLGAALLALVSGGVGGAVGAYLERNGGIDDVELPQAGTEAEGRAADSVAGIAASALPSVVTLHVSGSEAQGTGTGFVLDQRGHILTNNHVVDPADGSGEITVTFSGGQTAKAKVVGHDSGYDLAVVKVSGVSGLKPLALGNSDNVQVGDPVVAIGAPFDLENTVTAGIISAKERPITAGGEEGDGSDISYVDALQTDAPINPGNSGGPLVDSKARVIGINSAIRSADSGSDLEGGQSGSIGLGFAIPINQGKRVAEELINTGKATHPVIGVTLDMDYSGDGARVGTKGNDGSPPVNRNGPGDRAGIKPGDVITEVDGQRVRSGEELIVKTRSHRPGDRLELTLERDGKEKKVTLVLGSADGD
ncbi:S1C family serine protease [Streptomyces liliifuscus]|uniref:Trypsin-like peptidase domain-containing protein n=1 Tax=Streptomyces liliifuscus TaxID=2797636 RepID=A0A7T7I4Q4_9ACTN|nr:trypsin-like peptidase domain-containing protein [Streptomyces liliifuscus]QQM40988.1 trypsin-like peptidase domain-containing protein [Streptomyces liliifuscus]